MSLGDLFAPEEIFADNDGDGYIDELGITILLSPEVEDSSVWAGVLNLVARLSFETVTLQPLLVGFNTTEKAARNSLVVLPPGQKPPGYKEELPAGILLRQERGGVFVAGSSSETIQNILNALATGDYLDKASKVGALWDVIKVEEGVTGCLKVYLANRLLGRVSLSPSTVLTGKEDTPHREAPALRSVDLLNLTGKDGLYAIPEENPRQRVLRTCLHLHQPATSNKLGMALCEIVPLLALEATEMTLPVVLNRGGCTSEISIRIDEDSACENRIMLEDSQDDSACIQAAGSADFLADTLKGWFNRAFAKRGPANGQADSLREHVSEFKDIIFGNGYWGRWAHLLISENAGDDRLPIPETSKSRIEKARKTLGIPGDLEISKVETLNFRAEWKAETEKILEQISFLPRGNGKIQGTIFASKPLVLREALSKNLSEILVRKGYDPSLTVINAYKPGLCWLLEQVLPELKEHSDVSRLEVFYAPFIAGEKTLELRSRWLQELFPGPDLLARALNLDERKVQLIRNESLNALYRVVARDAGDRAILEQEFSPRCMEMEYLKAVPEMGLVHPCVSGICLQGEGGIMLDTELPSDRIVFWNEFQSNWLPEMERWMEERLRQESHIGQAAFWQEILIEVYIDETELILDFGDEHVSPMEALHEDLYFIMQDFFSRFAVRHSLPPEIQLGQVIPDVHATTNGSRPYAILKATPMLWAVAPAPVPRFSEQKCEVTAVGREKKAWFVDLKCSKIAFGREERGRLILLAKAWGYQVEWRGGNLRLQLPFAEIAGALPNENKKKCIPKGRMLVADEVEEWVEYCKTLPHLSVWRASNSWQGRAIHVIEAVLNTNKKRMSHAKMRLLKPTLLFNARHHANEISSTSATLELALFLSGTDEGRELLKYANVVMIPMENPDGVALLEKLLPDCRGHKLHAARYNALGAEFYSDYFTKTPRFPEALAKTRAWQRWLPEIVVDQHGVPGHEWEQPFAGYVPYRFREFWIPRTFAYAYLPFIDEPTHDHHRSAIQIAAALTRAMSEKEEITNLNRELSGRYRQYAFGPEPSVFPPSNGEPLLVFPPQDRTRKTNCAVRFPEITKSEIIVELPDEVVSGRPFDLCVEANRTIQKALIKLCRKPPCRIENLPDNATSGCHLRYRHSHQVSDNLFGFPDRQ